MAPLKYALILGSNSLEKVEFASMVALVSTSMGEEVELFATMDGVNAFTVHPKIASNTEAAKRIELVEGGGRYLEYFKKAKSFGKLKIIACSMATQLFGYKREDYSELVDSIGGLTSFIVSNEGSRMIEVW
ncbi:MAG: DsrE family protein [Thermoprotei archaeon]